MINLPELQYKFLDNSQKEMVKKYESIEGQIKEMKNEYFCFQQKYDTSENEMDKKYQSIQEQITKIKNEQVCFQQKSQTSESNIDKEFKSIQEQITKIKNEQACFQQKSQTSESNIDKKFQSIQEYITEIKQKQKISENSIDRKQYLMQGQITEIKKEQANFLQKQKKLEIGIDKYELMQGQMKKEQDSFQQQLKDLNKKCESTQGYITELKKEQNFFQSQFKNDMDKKYDSMQGQITEMKKEQAVVLWKLQLSVADCIELKEQIKKQNELSEKLEVFVQSQTSINEQFGFAMKQENLLNQLKEWLEALNLTKSIIKNQNTGYITKDVFDQMISDQFNLQKQFLNDESEQQTKKYLGSLQEQQTNLEATLVQFISKQEDLNNKNQSFVQNLLERISQIETKELQEIEGAFRLIFGRLNTIENKINNQQLNQLQVQLQEGLIQIDAIKDDINQRFLAQVEEQRKNFNKIIEEFEQIKVGFTQNKYEQNNNFNKIKEEFQQFKSGFTSQQNEQNKKESQQIKVGFTTQQNEQKKNVVIAARNVNQIQQGMYVQQTQPLTKPFQHCINQPQEFPNQIQYSPGLQKKEFPNQFQYSPGLQKKTPQLVFNKYQSPST